MVKTSDAIIIGAGVIGTAIAFELSRRGMRTLTLDRHKQAGHGSTAGSCACICMYYSTFEGTAFAWEGYHYWRDWADYLKLPADSPLSRYVETGCLVMKTEDNGYLANHIENSALLDRPYEEWSPETIEQRLPVYDLSTFAPARRHDDPAFGQSTGGPRRF